jgi:hypothetical protein
MKCISCGAENPNDAKFCRVCGKLIPTVPELKWVETSTVRIRYGGGGIFLNVLLTIGLLIALFTSVGFLMMYIEHGGRFYSDIVDITIIVWIITPIWLIVTCRRLSYGKRKTSQLRRIASDMEDSGRSNRYLTKSGKYGLYDWEKKKVLLPVEYDAFEPVNNGAYHIVLKQNKRGLYSCLLKAFIVPCEYDAITPFVNNVATIRKGDVTKRIDTQGNIF